MAASAWAGIAIGGLALAGLVGIGNARWNAATRRLRARLDAARCAPAPTHYSSSELQGLPAPVQRYFRTALTEGQPLVTAANVEHAGTFNVSESGARWLPLRSRQRIVARRPGFVWDGRIALLPGLALRVHDAYVAGEGILHPSLGGIVSLADLRDSGDLARDELMRFLAEAAWMPTALLPSQGVAWEPIDATCARATLRDGAIAVAVTFCFGADGMIETVRADARGRMVSGRRVATPWEGRWSGVQQHSGMRVPTAGEVAWLTRDGRKPYWRATITALAYEFAG